MKKYTITVECTETYEIITDSKEKAYDIADEMFAKADHALYLEDEEEV